jgi:hypothetical protein
MPLLLAIVHIYGDSQCYWWMTILIDLHSEYRS